MFDILIESLDSRFWIMISLVTSYWHSSKQNQYIFAYTKTHWASPVAQSVKSLPVKGKTWVQSLYREDHLEKGTSSHSSILAWRIPGTEEQGGVQSMGLQRVGHN